MGRKHPRRARQVPCLPTARIPGLPPATCRALDRLGRPDLGSHAVKYALWAWQRYTQIPRGPRMFDKDPSAQDMARRARRVLDAALYALAASDPRRAEPLHELVARMDAAFEAVTVPDPTADPVCAWWERRDWF